ncbi:MAG: hypothetical protein JWN70_4045 [Planctomycetaceae bacterium]|nr:hypothetical protein [Planctomycetaceae bacterium]
MNQECRDQSVRLKYATPDQAWLIATNSGESQGARMEALLILLRHRDPRIPELQLQLLDDADQQIWKSVDHTYNADRPEIRSALHQRLRDSDVETAVHAGMILARFNDQSIIPVFEAWLHDPERERRTAALAVLGHFKSPITTSLLTALWTDGWGDEENRLDLATKLTEAGHLAAREHVTSVAMAATGCWSVACATVVYFVDPRTGLKLMLHVLDSGDLEAKQGMVGQASSLFGRMPHAYTYDGLVEARQRVEQELASLDDSTGRPTVSKELEIQLAGNKEE